MNQHTLSLFPAHALRVTYFIIPSVAADIKHFCVYAINSGLLYMYFVHYLHKKPAHSQNSLCAGSFFYLMDITEKPLLTVIVNIKINAVITSQIPLASNLNNRITQCSICCSILTFNRDICSCVCIS